MEGQLGVRESGGGRSPFDALPEELWGHIFSRLPHLSRLQSRCVSLQWKRVISQLEAAAKRDSSECCLALERRKSEDEVIGVYVLEWTVTDANKKVTKLNLSFPPGWKPDVHGGIKGGGRSGLVALWDHSAGVFWVGSPVHDKWDKVPQPNTYRHGTFDRKGYELVAEEHSFHIVHFRLNVLALDGAGQGRNPPSWVIQVYSSRSRTWKTEVVAVDQVLFTFKHLVHTCVSGKRVYFLGYDTRDVETGFPTDDENDPSPMDTSPESLRLCSFAVWVFDVDSGVLSRVNPPGKTLKEEDCELNWSSLQVTVSQNSRFHLIFVGTPHSSPEIDKIYKYALDGDSDWVREDDALLDDHVHPVPGTPDIGLSWGITSLAYNRHEALEDAFPRIHGLTDYKVITIFSYNRLEKKWRRYLMGVPFYASEELEWPGILFAKKKLELPIVSFLPCGCCA